MNASTFNPLHWVAGATSWFTSSAPCQQEAKPGLFSSLWGRVFPRKPAAQPVQPSYEIPTIDFTSLQTPEEIRIAKYALGVLSEANYAMQQMTDDAETCRLVLARTKLFQKSENLDAEAQKMAKDLNIDVKVAKARLLCDASKLIDLTTAKLAQIESNPKAALKEGQTIVNLLAEIVKLKKEGHTTTSIANALDQAIRHKNTLSVLTRTCQSLINMAKQNKIHPPTFSALDQTICIHDGGNLLKAEGNFIYAEVPADQLACAKGLITPEAIRSLFDGKETKQGSIQKSFFSKTKVVEEAGGALTLYPIVRAKIENGKLIPDEKGSILLYQIPVTASIEKTDEIDFGDRQRVIFDKTGQYVAKLTKGFDGHALSNKKPNEERIRTAATSRAQALLVMQALLNAHAKGELIALDQNQLLRLFSHIDAISANDVAKLKGSFSTDPTFIAMRSIFDSEREGMLKAVLGRDVHNATKAIIQDKEFSWKESKGRIGLLWEIDRNIFGSTIQFTNTVLNSLYRNSFAYNRLSWFKERLTDVYWKVQGMQSHFREKLPFLKKGYKLPTDAITPELALLSDEAAITRALEEYNTSSVDFNLSERDLAVAGNSPKIRGKVHKYVSERPWWSCCREDASHIGPQMTFTTNKLSKAFGSFDVIAKTLVQGTHFSPALLDMIDFYETQKEIGYRREFARVNQMYVEQELHGYKAMKKKYFPNR